MRIVTNKELSSYKVLPFDLYTENKGKILEAGEVLTPGKLIMLKNYVKIYTEEFGSEEESEGKVEAENGTPSQLLNFSYEGIDAADFETVRGAWPSLSFPASFYHILPFLKRAKSGAPIQAHRKARQKT